jgi:hypothetical protein
MSGQLSSRPGFFLSDRIASGVSSFDDNSDDNKLTRPLLGHGLDSASQQERQKEKALLPQVGSDAICFSALSGAPCVASGCLERAAAVYLS